MKVLIPTLHYPPVIGGFEIFTKNVSERLGKTEVSSIYIVTGKVMGQPQYEQKKNLHIYRTSSLYTLSDYSYSSYWYIGTMLPFLFIRSLWIVYSQKIDIIHAQGFISGIVSLLLHLVTRRPYVITIQSADFSIYHSEVKNSFFIRLQALVERVIYRNATVCHAVSNDLVEHFKNQGRSDAIMIPNGVEMNLFRPISAEEKKDMRRKIGLSQTYLVSCLSRLQEKNGTHDVILAMAEIRKKRDDVGCVIIGDGVERQRLEEMVDSLGLRDVVAFVGDIEHDVVSPYIACSDVFVRPSLAEGFGIVFLEAMACSVPVVGTAVGGIVDFLHDGETGLLARVSDPVDVAHKISMILDDKELAKDLINHSSAVLKKKYSWDAITLNIEKQVYRAALK